MLGGRFGTVRTFRSSSLLGPRSEGQQNLNTSNGDVIFEPHNLKFGSQPSLMLYLYGLLL